MAELLRCQSCSATLERGNITGYCPTCKKQHCKHCVRMCEGCLKNFCMFDIVVREVWRNQAPKIMKLCGICEQVWR